MPIYEYACKACGHEFELLVLPGATQPACPECRNSDLEKLLSGFALSTLELTKSRVKKARTRYMASKELKDKNVAEIEHIREHMPEPFEEMRKKKS